MLKQLEQIGTLEELKHYRCKLVTFSETHLILGIRIHHHQIAGLRWMLYFVGVFYIQCPIFWTGANFVEASKEISFNIWKTTHPDMSDERLNQLYMSTISSVCMIETATQPILIEYGGVSISKEENIYPK